MSRVTCAISGMKLGVSYLDSLTISHTAGYIHPVFTLERLALYPLYREHCLGKLTATDSYLVFLAFLHSSSKLDWLHPASCNPNDPKTRMLIEKNISQLVAVLEKTDLISHPHFEQPSFKVYVENSSLAQIGNWIAAWEDNISDFYTKKASQVEVEDLQRLENKLTAHIYSGNPPEKYARVIANWADKAADFPPHCADLWKETIRSCFSITKMFNTPLPLLKEIKDYIECNIPVGSMHFTAVYDVIKEGISKHEDYLGGSSLALGYTLLPTLDSITGAAITPTNEAKGVSKLASIVAGASGAYPVRANYPDGVAFLRAKLAYRVASNIAAETSATSAQLPVPATTATTTTQTKLLVDCDTPLPKTMSDSLDLELEELEEPDLEDLIDGLTVTDTPTEGYT